ncbi:MAG: hypothetical protein AAF485_25080, partial [Chloroflexota bacterium]
LLFPTLTTQVDNKTFRLHFGFGVIYKKFRLEAIESFQIVKNPWYYGWGIRYTPRGWLFNVSGLSAIELKTTQGKTYRVGTDDPQGLAQALVDSNITQI